MLQIKKVEKYSPAYTYGFQKGDKILQLDGYDALDELDYIYCESKSSFTVKVEDKHGIHELTVEKDENEPFGLEFEPSEAIRTCHNRCIFCFVDQMPKGMRPSLYVKDDDYSMSLLCGNFVTLTNFTDEDIERVLRLKLSPLYVSVQCMNEALRCKLLRNRFAGKITKQIQTLAEGGIFIHCQGVIVPGMNDGKELEYTARELFRYYPQVVDLAVVPTGITKYREGLTYIPDVDGAYSAELLDLVDRLNAEFGVNFILPADEYFIKAGRPMKDASFYGDFSQIENGIGMTTRFVTEFMQAAHPVTLKKKKTALLVSGTSAAGVNREVGDCAESNVQGLKVEVLSVKNEFFGETVTCTGLLTGQDIVNAVLASGICFDELILPSNTLKEFEDIFLDGMTLKQFKKKIKKKVYVNRTGGVGLWQIFSGEKATSDSDEWR